MSSVVYLVDDDPAVLRSLSRVLAEEGFDPRSFASGEAFLEHADSLRGGCLVLDMTMPGMSGLEVQRWMEQAGIVIPVVFLTGHGDIPTTVRAMKAGASNFLTKPVTAAALVEAVRGALAEGQALQGAANELAEFARRFESLTLREREVLAGLVAGKLNKQIAVDLGIVEQTVKFHRARIMERMQARTVAELMHITARLPASLLSSAAPRSP